MLFLTSIIVLGYGLLCAFAGWQICRTTHRQRGIEIDPLDIVKGDGPLPMGLVVPDDARDLTNH